MNTQSATAAALLCVLGFAASAATPPATPAGAAAWSSQLIEKAGREGRVVSTTVYRADWNAEATAAYTVKEELPGPCSVAIPAVFNSRQAVDDRLEELANSRLSAKERTALLELVQRAATVYAQDFARVTRCAK